MLFDKELLDAIGGRLIGKKETIAVAESVTSGLLQAALSCATNASCFFQGGITAYNLGQKCRHLSVEPVQALECNCVSDTVTGQMAREVCKMFLSEYGVAITGYATTVPEKNIHQLYAHVCVAKGEEIVLSQKLEPGEDTAFDAQVNYTRQVLSLLHKLV